MPVAILLTGASGYIRSRPLRVPEEGDCAVPCLARQPERVVSRRTTSEVVVGDCFDEASLVDGQRNPTVVRSPAARQTFEIRPMPSIGAPQSLYQDRIEFAVSRRGALNRVAAALLRPVLTLAFAHCHRVVRASVGCARRPSTPRRATALVVVLAAVAALQPGTARGQTPASVRTVPFVDLERYAGDWFEIARFPNRFQRQCVGDVRASYALRPDGRLDVVNRCRTTDGQTEARGVARIADEQTFARLKVRFAPVWLSFLPVVWGDYWIVGLAPDYSWAVVGDPGRDYLWILARAPHPDDESVAAARAAARASGYDVERLVPTPHAGGRPTTTRTAVATAAMAVADPSPAQDTAGMAALRGRVLDPRYGPQENVAVCAAVVSQCVGTYAGGAFMLMVRPGSCTLELATPGQPPESQLLAGAALDGPGAGRGAAPKSDDIAA